MPRCLECLNEGGLADAVVAAHKHLGHVQRHSARVEQAQQVALLIVDGAGGGGETSSRTAIERAVPEMYGMEVR